MLFFNNCLVLSAALGASAGRLGKYATVVDPAVASQITYDFIIVGGGTAGLTVADRLTENPLTTVLVLEFGPFDQGEPGVLIPGQYFPVPYFWPGLLSVPQPNLNGGPYFVPTGAVVGGGSAINAMFFLRCAAEEYNAWEAFGSAGWGWNSLLPYFKKSETFTPPDPSFAKAHNISYDLSVHGFSGPIQGSYPNYDYAPAKNFWNAALAVGIAANPEPNGGDSNGLFSMLKSLDPKTETRSYAKTGHYDRVIKTRPNYHLITNQLVSKVLFDGHTANGVQYSDRTSGNISTAYACKEIIVAAGAVHTPQVLQLSGIGPKALLHELNITTLVDLPGVGANLQDHLVFTSNYNFSANLQPNGGELLTNQTYNNEQYALYNASQPSAYSLTLGTGNEIVLLPLKNTTTNWASIIAQAAAENATALLPPDADPTVIAGYKAQRAVILSEFAGYATSVGAISWSTGPTTVIYMMKPLSRGSVKIASTDATVNPNIDYGALNDEADLEILLALVKKNRDIMGTSWMQVLGPTELAPTGGLTTDDALKAALRANLTPTNAHQCCTAAMLPRSLGGVVDNNLLVYGVNGLSAVSAAVFPKTPSGAPQASVYAVAEKAADLIKLRHVL